MFKKLGINRFEKITYIAILILLATVTVMFYFYPDQLWQAVQEDAIFENMTILVLIACLVICINNSRKLIARKNHTGSLVYILLSLGLFFVIGEELSWGQRIFNINSGSYFLENNTQSETNLHNLQIGNTRINTLIFTQLGTIVLAVYFLFSRLLCKKIKWFENIRKRFSIPLPKLHHTIFFYFAFLMVYIFDYKRNDEVFELILPCIFMLIFLYPYKPETEVSAN
ncbi:MAG: hypothetical protein HQ541_11355 [Mariniphaga sp.]|nr:hypothetical protein [Mariniphaga sp.]